MDEAKVSGLAAGEAYISGALTGIEDAPRMKLFYELLAEIAGAAKLRPYLPHRVTDPVATAHLDPRAVYEIDRAHVTAAAVVVAYAGLPSFGVGIEVELAREDGIPVIIVAETWAHSSFATCSSGRSPRPRGHLGSTHAPHAAVSARPARVSACPRMLRRISSHNGW